MVQANMVHIRDAMEPVHSHATMIAHGYQLIFSYTDIVELKAQIAEAK